MIKNIVLDRFNIIIERQEQLEALIREWGFLPFFKNGIPGFSIEEMSSQTWIRRR